MFIKDENKMWSKKLFKNIKNEYNNNLKGYSS